MSQIIILDTHIWLWLVNGNFDLFPTRWRELIESAERVGISPDGIKNRML
jgi:PIN domain nuclease of toxin-antitoxin system